VQSLQIVLDQLVPYLDQLAVHDHLSIHTPQPLPTIAMDSNRIAQVISNLVENAVKYSPVGTDILFDAYQQGDDLFICVTDQGIGIPVADRQTVFEVFRRSNNVPYQSRSSGLGLAICKGIVEAHGGAIWVEESAIQGTRIVFTLPIAI
jgi:two-component system, OmpR family, sensor histidine kinase KdpD